MFVKSYLDWLMHEDQKEIYELTFASTLNLVFVGLAALVLWPLGRAAMAWSLLKGFWVFWFLLFLTAVVLAVIQRVFRIDVDSHFDAYVIPALVLSAFLQAGWSAFVALTVRGYAADAPVWLAVVLYFVGTLFCFSGAASVGAYYGGAIYRTINTPLAFASFLLFCAWPAAARATYGWFFNLF